jgi:hypothetical protein
MRASLALTSLPTTVLGAPAERYLLYGRPVCNHVRYNHLRVPTALPQRRKQSARHDEKGRPATSLYELSELSSSPFRGYDGPSKSVGVRPRIRHRPLTEQLYSRRGESMQQERTPSLRPTTLSVPVLVELPREARDQAGLQHTAGCPQEKLALLRSAALARQELPAR